MAKKAVALIYSCLLLFLSSQAQGPGASHASGMRLSDSLDELFRHPPEQAKPWVFWYWMQAAVTKEGIAADLQAMKETGIGGAYMMFI